MLALNLATGLMVVGLLAAAPVFADGSEQAGKQHVQEFGGTTQEPCTSANNANPNADPNCRQRVQNLNPSPTQGMSGSQAANGNQR
jgi:hypothetical protein